MSNTIINLHDDFIAIFRKKLSEKRIAYPNTDWSKWEIKVYVYIDEYMRRQQRWGVYGCLRCTGPNNDKFKIVADADCPLPPDLDEEKIIFNLKIDIEKIVEDYKHANIRI